MYVLEYSQSQKAFHIQSLDSALSMGIRSLFSNQDTGYMILLISSNKDALHEISDKMKIRDERDREFTIKEMLQVSDVIEKHHDKLIGF